MVYLQGSLEGSVVEGVLWDALMASPHSHQMFSWKPLATKDGPVPPLGLEDHTSP